MMPNRRLGMKRVAELALIVAVAGFAAAVLISCEYFDPLDPLSRGPRQPDPTVTWEQVFGGAISDDAGMCIQQTEDGGFIIAGYMEPQPVAGIDTQTDVWLVKTDSLGDVEWQDHYGGAGYDRGYYVEQTADRGYIVVGSREFDRGGGSWDADLWLFKIKPDHLGEGEIDWEQVYGDSGTDEEGSCVRRTADGRYIITGTKMDSGLGHECLWLLKTDDWGVLDTNWATNPQSFWETSATYGECVIETFSDLGDVTGYIAVGNTATGTAEDAYLVKTDALGVIDSDWTDNPRTFGFADEPDFAYFVQQTSDGGYILTGKTRSFNAACFDALLIKLDASGELDPLWGGENPKTIQVPGDDGFDERANCVQQTSDGGYILTGTSHFRDQDAWLVKTDAFGNMEWEEYFGDQGYDEMISVRETDDGGYIMAGLTSSFYGGFNLYLVYYRP